MLDYRRHYSVAMAHLPGNVARGSSLVICSDPNRLRAIRARLHKLRHDREFQSA